MVLAGYITELVPLRIMNAAASRSYTNTSVEYVLTLIDGLPVVSSGALLSSVLSGAVDSKVCSVILSFEAAMPLHPDVRSIESAAAAARIFKSVFFMYKYPAFSGEFLSVAYCVNRLFGGYALYG